MNREIDMIREQYGDKFVELKPSNMSWNEYYGFLYNNYKIGLSGKKHYWDRDVQSNEIIKLLYETKIPTMWLEKYSQNIDTKGADFAADMNNFYVLNWLATQRIFPNILTIVNLAINGNENVFPFMMKYNMSPDIIADIAIESARNGHINFIKYIPQNIVNLALNKAIERQDIQALEFLTTYPVLHFLGYPGIPGDPVTLKKIFINNIPNNVLIYLIESGKLKIIQWLINNGKSMEFLVTMERQDLLIYLIANGIILNTDDISRGIYPNVNTANLAARQGNLNMIMTLAEYNILPDVKGANEAALFGHLDILRFLTKYRIFPDVEGANNAAYGYLDILKFLESYGIFPNTIGANNAAKKGQFEILKYLIEHGIYPNVEGANDAVADDNLDIIEFLASYGIFPDVSGANEAASIGELDILKFLEKYKILPDINGANDACDVGGIKVLEWLEQHSILPDYRGANIAYEVENNEVLDWLAERNIYPIIPN